MSAGTLARPDQGQEPARAAAIRLIGVMSIYSVDKKLREAAFFLEQMRQCERLPPRLLGAVRLFPERVSQCGSID